MVQRDDLLPIAFGGLLLGLVTIVALPFNAVLFGALATCLLAVWGSCYGHGASMVKAKSAVLSTRIFTEQYPSPTVLQSEAAIDLLDSIRRAQQPEAGSQHEAEKKRLLQSLKRGYSWSSSHPRHRLLDALFGFQSYYESQRDELERFRGFYRHVGQKHRTLLDLHVQYSTKFDRVDEHLALNQLLCDKIVQNALAYYDISTNELKKHSAELLSSGKRAEKVTVSQALKHYVRDWTEGGINEREETFPALLGTLQALFPHRGEGRSTPSSPRVLLPGSGLNRLAHDVARLGGFHVTANEWSAYMNIAYRFLEANPAAGASALHPFADSWSHHVSESDMLRAVRFPDVSLVDDAPSSSPSSSSSSSSVLLVEGDFTAVFRDRAGSYDALVTYFFIDTARDLMVYLDTIVDLLRPGGYWINLGPLLYGTGPRVQLTLEEIITVTETMGFEYLDTDDKYGPLTIPGRTVRTICAVYSFNGKALTSSAYKAQFWVARKM